MTSAADQRDPSAELTPADSVLAALDEATARYLEMRTAWDGDLEAARRECVAARDECSTARNESAAARTELARARADLDAERKRAIRDRDRATRLAAALKDVHRAAFAGNVFDQILRAALAITGATRGLYVTAWGDGRLIARAARDVDGYPRKAPSAFVRALCERVLPDRHAVVISEAAGFAGYPPPDGAGETFRDCLVAPAVLLQKFSGVVILADKPGGFHADDADQVMAVGDHAETAVEGHLHRVDVERAYFDVVGVLADAMEAKDPYTRGHCELVARLARRTAARLAADDRVRGAAGFGGLLHDVGKIGVSDGVLNKPGKLLPEEWELMKSHVRVGRDLLARVPALAAIADVAYRHHEQYDGRGYPDGLKGDEVPLAARIVGAVDAYTAMTSKRSYKESVSADAARAELVRCKGTQFDPAVVDALLAVLDDPGAVEPAGDEPPDGYDATEFRHVLPPAPDRP